MQKGNVRKGINMMGLGIMGRSFVLGTCRRAWGFYKGGFWGFTLTNEWRG